MAKLIERRYGFEKREKVVIEFSGYDLQSSGFSEAVRQAVKNIVGNDSKPHLVRMSMRVEKSEPA